jgi:hypothetical protein
MDPDTRLRLAKAITDAKTSFFIQCSSKISKWRTISIHAHTESRTVLPSGGIDLDTGKTIPRLPCGVARIIERLAGKDKQTH